MNSISKSEMNIRISLCNVRRVNGMLDISLNRSEKDALTEKKKIQNCWETIVILEILNFAMKRKIHSFIPSISYGNLYGNSEISLAIFKTDM